MHVKGKSQINQDRLENTLKSRGQNKYAKKHTPFLSMTKNHYYQSKTHSTLTVLTGLESNMLNSFKSVNSYMNNRPSSQDYSENHAD